MVFIAPRHLGCFIQTTGGSCNAADDHCFERCFAKVTEIRGGPELFMQRRNKLYDSLLTNMLYAICCSFISTLFTLFITICFVHVCCAKFEKMIGLAPPNYPQHEHTSEASFRCRG